MLYQFKFPSKILAVTVHLLINAVLSLQLWWKNSAAARLGTARSAKP